MSNLLEQAIVDAAALREVALKNAEAALIEKYSKEFKESVEKLLEQENPAEEPAAIEDPMAAMAATPDASAGADEKEKAFDDVESSFLEGDQNQVITIDFDQLKKQVSDAMGINSSLLSTPPAAPAATPEAAPMMEEKELEEVYDQGANSSFKTDALDGKLEEEDVAQEDMLVKKKKKNGHTMPPAAQEGEYEFELEESAADQIPAAEQAVGVAQKRLGDLKAKAAAEKEEEEKRAALQAVADVKKMEEDIEITEEELNELAEQLKVEMNIDNLSDGHMGTTVTQKREQRNMELAAARDAEETEKRAEEEKTMSDLKSKLDEAIELGSALVEENEELNKQNEYLKEKLAEITGHLDTLKENVEKLSISNAKLLYTNKVLGDVSLNERQKQQIVENISKSTSVLEAKTIYTALQGTVSGVASSKPKESLSEALIRGNSPFLTRKQQTTEIPFAERMKKLAGI